MAYVSVTDIPDLTCDLYSSMILAVMLRGSRPSDHYFRSVCLCLFVCLFVQSFFSAVFDPIWIKLGHMLHVRV